MVIYMNKSKKIHIDLDKIIEKNPAIDAKELVRNLEIIQELKKRGVKIGPNYNLGSPFSKPEPYNSETDSIGTTLQQI